MRDPDIERLWPLREVASKLKIYGIVVTYKQLSEWASRDTTDFPLPERTLGHFTFYNLDEVADWIVLWRRATVNMGRGAELNGEREDSDSRDDASGA